MNKWIYFLFVNLMLMPQTVFGHSRLKNAVLADGQVFAPRSTNDGIKVGPCGGDARTAGVTLKPGQNLTVNWEETINHPGFFRLYQLNANGGIIKLLGEMQDNANGALPHQFNMTVTLDNNECAQCTVQLIQYMTEVTPPSLYYSCADIVLSNAAVVANPTPSPGTNTGSNPPATSGNNNSATGSQEILRACGGGTKVSSINASLSFALLLPVAGLLRRRKK
jgi:hypothetical protein